MLQAPGPFPKALLHVLRAAGQTDYWSNEECDASRGEGAADRSRKSSQSRGAVQRLLPREPARARSRDSQNPAWAEWRGSSVGSSRDQAGRWKIWTNTGVERVPRRPGIQFAENAGLPRAVWQMAGKYWDPGQEAGPGVTFHPLPCLPRSLVFPPASTPEHPLPACSLPWQAGSSRVWLAGSCPPMPPVLPSEPTLPGFMRTGSFGLAGC